MARKGRKRPTPQTVVILGEGITERSYFNCLKNNLTYIAVKIKPELPTSSDITSIEKKAKSLIQQGYDRVFCLVDKDHYLHQGALDKFKTIVRKYKSKENSRIRFFINMPCFEVWLLFHYEFTTKCFHSCDNLIRALKNHCSTYEKTDRSIKELFNNWYKRLEQAKCNSGRLREHYTTHDCGEDALRCDVDLLIDKLKQL